MSAGRATKPWSPSLRGTPFAIQKEDLSAVRVDIEFDNRDLLRMLESTIGTQNSAGQTDGEGIMIHSLEIL